MPNTTYVGRVGALAVALGIGGVFGAMGPLVATSVADPSSQTTPSDNESPTDTPTGSPVKSPSTIGAPKEDDKPANRVTIGAGRTDAESDDEAGPAPKARTESPSVTETTVTGTITGTTTTGAITQADEPGDEPGDETGEKTGDGTTGDELETGDGTTGDELETGDGTVVVETGADPPENVDPDQKGNDGPPAATDPTQFTATALKGGDKSAASFSGPADLPTGLSEVPGDDPAAPPIVVTTTPELAYGFASTGADADNDTANIQTTQQITTPQPTFNLPEPIRVVVRVLNAVGSFFGVGVPTTNAEGVVSNVPLGDFLVGAFMGLLRRPDVSALNGPSATVAAAAAATSPNVPPVANPVTPVTLDPLLPGDPPGTIRGHVNVTDANGDVLDHWGSTWTSKGAVSINRTTGTFVYQPYATARHAAAAANAAATGADRDTFTVTVTDNRGGTIRIPVTVAISPANNAPTPASPPTVNAPNTSTGVVTGNLNVRDTDWDTLTFTVSGAPTKGSVAIAANGSFTYTPTVPARQQAYSTPGEDYDSFTVTVTDGYGGSLSVPVTQIKIQPLAPQGNTPPVANPTNPYSIDGSQSGDPAGSVRGHVNVTDPNADPLTYTGSTSTTKGSVTVNSTTGAFIYTPTAAARHDAAATNAAQTGANRDTFTITASDGKGGTVGVQVTVTISPTNAAPTPTAAPSVSQPNANGDVTGNLNIRDADLDTLTFTVTGPAKGQVTFSQNGTFTYTPTVPARQAAYATPGEDYDAFSVTVTDAHGGSLTVQVNQIVIKPLAPTTNPANPSVAGSIPAGASYPFDATVSRDGTKLFVVNFDNHTLSTYSTATGQKLSTTTVGMYPGSAVESLDGSKIYVSSTYYDVIHVIDTATGTTSYFSFGKHPGALALSPDGTRLYATNFTTGEFVAIDTQTNTIVGKTTVGTRPGKMVLSTDGQRAYVLNSDDNTVSVIDTSGSTPQTVGSPIAVGAQDDYSHLAVTPDGTKVYVTNPTGNSVTVINTATRQTQTVAVGTNPWGVSVSPDGSRAYVANAVSNTVSVIDTATNTVVYTLALGTGGYPIDVTFSPDGTKAYVLRVTNGFSGGDIVVINTGTGAIST